MNIFNFGAINAKTKIYELAFNAKKINSYVCPECNNKVILKQGNIRVHHFAHSNEEIKCEYYLKPSESQIHKEAKLILKHLLENNFLVKFKRTCKNGCCTKKLKISHPNETTQVKLEYKFPFNGSNKVADLACVENNDEIWCICEIFVTHKTEELNRPEPWFEVDGKQLLQVNLENKIVKLNCLRLLECKNKYKNDLQQLLKLTKINEFVKPQEKYCFHCCKSKYIPIVFNNNGYACCEPCCKTYFSELHNEINRLNIIKLETEIIKKFNNIPVIYKFTSEPYYSCRGCYKKYYYPIKHNNKYYAVCKTCKESKFNNLFF